MDVNNTPRYSNFVAIETFDQMTGCHGNLISIPELLDNCSMQVTFCTKAFDDVV